MPELPEIETVKRSLEPHILNEYIAKIEVRCNALRYPITNLDIPPQSKIIKLFRRAKYLLIELSTGFTIIVHLGMSGRLTHYPDDYQLSTHDHIIFHLNNKKKLVLNDVRRFGMVYILPSSNLLNYQMLQHLGPEPLSEDFNLKYCKAKFITKRPTKNIMMDNRFVVGIGNIYASEILYRCKIHPSKSAYTITEQELRSLVANTKEVISQAIEAGGTTLRDFVDGSNQPGKFQQKLLVYNRTGERCGKCRNEILKIRQAGRSSYYCSGCQVIE